MTTSNDKSKPCDQFVFPAPGYTSMSSYARHSRSGRSSSTITAHPGTRFTPSRTRVGSKRFLSGYIAPSFHRTPARRLGKGPPRGSDRPPGGSDGRLVPLFQPAPRLWPQVLVFFRFCDPRENAPVRHDDLRAPLIARRCITGRCNSASFSAIRTGTVPPGDLPCWPDGSHDDVLTAWAWDS